MELSTGGMSDGKNLRGETSKWGQEPFFGLPGFLNVDTQDLLRNYFRHEILKL